MDTNEIIKRVIEKTFASLITQPTTKVCNDEGLRIVYPRRKNEGFRLSEQELKQTFIYFLEKETKLYYSVETPTLNPYRFTGDGNVPRVCEDGDGRSANIDLSIYENLQQVEKGEPFANIEFKSGNPKEDDFKKDLLKLYNEPAIYGYFLHVVKSFDEGTRESLSDKLSCQDLANKFPNKVSVFLFNLSDSEGIIHEILSDGTFK